MPDPDLPEHLQESLASGEETAPPPPEKPEEEVKREQAAQAAEEIPEEQVDELETLLREVAQAEAQRVVAKFRDGLEETLSRAIEKALDQAYREVEERLSRLEETVAFLEREHEP